MPKLHPHIGVPARKRRVLPTLATTAILLVATGLPVSLFSKTFLVNHELSASQKAEEAFMAPLSVTDLRIYRDAFSFERAGDQDKANLALQQVHNPVLKGVLTGERFLKEGSDASFSDMALWLSRFSDHPQAQAIYRKARNLAPDVANFIAEPQKHEVQAVVPAVFDNTGTGQEPSELPDKKAWEAGLDAYRRGDMQSARRQFDSLSKNGENELSGDDNAALAFWSFRAAMNQHDKDAALEALHMAADEPAGFYSILARQILNDPRTKPAAVEEDRFFRQKPGVRRAKALHALGQDALAQKELHALSAEAGETDSNQVTALAQALGMPLAGPLVVTASASGNAHYPVPSWKPILGYRLDPALLFAIMRKESGFNPDARSASGALGVMQLMPATAHAMARDAQLAVSSEPAVSMTLGQHYLQRLMDISTIDNNLVFIIAAYNAGPGNVEKWQKRLDIQNDPLLFIESIPSATARDYVVHVMGNYWVYSQMLGGYGNSSVQALAQNQWPYYAPSDKQTAMAARSGGDLQ